MTDIDEDARRRVSVEICRAIVLKVSNHVTVVQLSS
jgi:hypothetical protein